MSILSRWLHRIINDEEKKQNANEKVMMAEPISDNEYGCSLNITVTTVTGGKIVSFRSYNRTTDRSSNTTYIIHPDEHFEDSLAKLINIEEMKM